MQDRIKQLEEENSRLRSIIATHDLCHDEHGNVGAREFAQCCAQEQRKYFGCAPHADLVVKQRRLLFAMLVFSLIQYIIITVLVSFPGVIV